MLKKIKALSGDQTVWVLVGAVFLSVLLVLITVFNHDKEKPKSPQALVAAAFSNVNTFNVKEWKPGMGSRPFMYHPAGFNSLVWRPLPPRTGFGGRTAIPSPAGSFGNTPLYPRGPQPIQPWQR